MLHIDRGIIFNGLKEILLIGSGEFKDDKSIWIAALGVANIKVSPYSSYSRKLSRGELTVKDHIAFMHRHLSDEQYAMLLKSTVGSEDKLISVLDDSALVQDVCSAALIANLPEEKEKYVHFLNALSLKDKIFTEQLLADPTNEQWIIERFNEEVASVMLLPGFRGDRKLSQQRFLVARLMYWAALGELYLRVFSEGYVKDKGSLKAGITLFLPTIDSKGRLIRSQEKFLDHAKSIWAKEKHRGELNIKDHEFFEDITDAQLPKRMKIDSPDVSRVKKIIQRLRSNTRLTLEKFEHLIASLYVGRDSKNSSLSAAVLVPLVSAFDKVQDQLEKDGFERNLIVGLFKDYERYVDLVNAQFEHFEIQDNRSLTDNSP